MRASLSARLAGWLFTLCVCERTLPFLDVIPMWRSLPRNTNHNNQKKTTATRGTPTRRSEEQLVRIVLVISSCEPQRTQSAAGSQSDCRALHKRILHNRGLNLWRRKRKRGGPADRRGLFGIPQSLYDKDNDIQRSAVWRQRKKTTTVSLVSRVPSFCCDGRTVEINRSLESPWSTKLKSITFNPNRAIFDEKE